MVGSEQKAKNVEAFESVVKVAALGGAPIAPLTDWYSLAPIQPTGGHWYFSYACPECGHDTPLFRDFSDGDLGNPFVAYGVKVTCYFCEASIQCASEGIHSTQWPLERGQERPVSEYAHRVVRKYNEDPKYRPLAGPLHHYTSIDALLSIVETKALWATSVHYLNDSSEGELGLELVRHVGAEARKVAEGADAQFLDFFLKWLDGSLWESASVYVLCFSEERDQLSQWRGYTPHGRGVCLSIDSHSLVERAQAYGWTFQNCRYNRTSQLAWAEAILSRMRREAATGSAASKGDEESKFDAVIQQNLSDLLQVAATIKDEAFQEEREVRFISPMLHVGDPSIAYRVGRTTLLPYIEFRLAEQGESLRLDEIMVGPSPTQHLTRSAVTGLATSGQISEPCIVSASSIPYREV